MLPWLLFLLENFLRRLEGGSVLVFPPSFMAVRIATIAKMISPEGRGNGQRWAVGSA